MPSLSGQGQFYLFNFQLLTLFSDSSRWISDYGLLVEWCWQRKTSAWRKTLPSATLSTTNLTWTLLASNSDVRSERPATNCLSNGREAAVRRARGVSSSSIHYRCSFKMPVMQKHQYIFLMWRKADNSRAVNGYFCLYHFKEGAICLQLISKTGREVLMFQYFVTISGGTTSSQLVSYVLRYTLPWVLNHTKGHRNLSMWTTFYMRVCALHKYIRQSRYVPILPWAAV